MKECYFAREPFDLRLAALRLSRNAGRILALTLAGTLIFGGGYFIKNVLFRPADTYGAKSVYYVEYGTDPRTGEAYTYINAYSWNVWIRTEEFRKEILSRLETGGLEPLPDLEQLTGYLSADLPSDLRLPVSLVTTPDPDLSLRIAEAVEESFVAFGEKQAEITSIRVVDPARKAEKVFLDVRPARAFLLSAVLTFFFVLIGFLLKETGDDSIWLPAALARRHGLKVLGTAKSRELAENLRYVFRGKRKIGITAVTGDTDLEAVLERLPRSSVEAEWEIITSVMQEPENASRLRETDGILLVVKAGPHAGKRLERVLEVFRTQDCEVTAALLWEADEQLIRRYDRFGGPDPVPGSPDAARPSPASGAQRAKRGG